MTLPNTDIIRHQAGVLRIEMVAIIMLLTALAIVLISDAAKFHRPGNKYDREPARVVPDLNIAAGMLTDPDPAPQQLADPEADSP